MLAYGVVETLAEGPKALAQNVVCELITAEFGDSWGSRALVFQDGYGVGFRVVGFRFYRSAFRLKG